MWAKDRHHRIVTKLAATARVSIEELVEDLQVSRETVRRDIVALEAEGKLRRIHGGVERVSTPVEPPFEERKVVNASAKRRIANGAARLVKPGMLVAIDAGTTTIAFADAIANIPNVTIVSNSHDVVSTILQSRSDAEVILLGGRVSMNVPGTHGSFAISGVQRFAPDICVISPVGVCPERGVTDFQFVEAELAQAMISCSKQVVMLADHTKLGHVSRVEICQCSSVDTLVTDHNAPEETLSALREALVKEIIVE